MEFVLKVQLLTRELTQILLLSLVVGVCDCYQGPLKLGPTLVQELVGGSKIHIRHSYALKHNGNMTKNPQVIIEPAPQISFL